MTGQLDIAFHSNTGFAYILTLAVTLTLIVLVRKRPVEKIAMVTAKTLRKSTAVVVPCGCAVVWVAGCCERGRSIYAYLRDSKRG